MSNVVEVNAVEVNTNNVTQFVDFKEEINVQEVTIEKAIKLADKDNQPKNRTMLRVKFHTNGFSRMVMADTLALNLELAKGEEVVDFTQVSQLGFTNGKFVKA